MPLRQLLEEFGLDAELIYSDREMSEGLAKAHYERAMALRADKEDKKDHYFTHVMASATESRRAGAHAVLLSDNESVRNNFVEAGLRYEDLGKPYGQMMFCCAVDQVRKDLPDGLFRSELPEELDRTQLPYLALILAGSPGERNREQFDRTVHALEAFQKTPIGLLGISGGAWLDLAIAIARGDEREMILQGLLPFLATYSTAIRRCAADEYHWKRLAFPFHPVEPDILSVVFHVESLLRRRKQDSLLNILPDMHLDRLACRLLSHAIRDQFGERSESSDDEPGGWRTR